MRFTSRPAPAAAVQQRAFVINIGKRGAPRLSFACMAPDACTAHAQHVDLADVGERVEVVPAGAARDGFAITAERQALGCAHVRDAIVEAARIRADIAEDEGKAERRFAVTYRRAVDDQVNYLRCAGVL